MMSNTAKRFLDKVNMSGKCYIWTGAKTSKGYGLFKVGKKLLLAHRVAYDLYKKPIEKGKYILHTCDNPSCVRLSHLVMGTQKLNMEHRRDRNRVKTQILTWSDVQYMRQLKSKGYSIKRLGVLFKVSYETAKKICNGERW